MMPKSKNVKNSNNQQKSNNGSPKVSVILAPVAKASRVTMSNPVFRSLPNGNIRVKHSEYISEVFGSVNFTAVKYSIQPGIQASFPWLSLMAPLYESYQMKSLKYSFLTEKSTSTNGVVLMAVDYDAQDSNPPNKTSMMSYSGATRTQPWADTHLVCPSQALLKFPERYVRSGATTGDIKTFDIGNLFIATQGNADSSVLGELHVSYEIEFRTPQLDQSVFASLGSSSNVATVGISGTKILGTSPTLNIPPSGLPLSYDTVTGGIVFGAVGSYLLTINVGCTSNTGVFAASMTGGSSVSGIAQAGTTTVLLIFTVNVLNATDVLSTSGITFVLPTLTQLRVSSYPFGI